MYSIHFKLVFILNYMKPNTKKENVYFDYDYVERNPNLIYDEMKSSLNQIKANKFT